MVDEVRERLALIRDAAKKLSIDDIETGEEAACLHCGETIYAVIDPVSLVFDWGSNVGGHGLDFGCDANSEHECDDDPDDCDCGVGSHDPGDNHTRLGFKIPHICKETTNGD